MGWVDEWRCVVYGGGGLAEADGNQRDLAGVGGDVAGGVDAGMVGSHCGVNEKAPLLKIEAPLGEGTDVGNEAESCDHGLCLECLD